MTDEAADRLIIEPLVAAKDVTARRSSNGGHRIRRRVPGAADEDRGTVAATRSCGGQDEEVRVPPGGHSALELADVDVETERVEALAELGRRSRASADADTCVRSGRHDIVEGVTVVLRPGGRVLWFGAPPADEPSHGLSVGLAPRCETDLAAGGSGWPCHTREVSTEMSVEPLHRPAQLPVLWWRDRGRVRSRARRDGGDGAIRLSLLLEPREFEAPGRVIHVAARQVGEGRDKALVFGIRDSIQRFHVERSEFTSRTGGSAMTNHETELESLNPANREFTIVRSK